MKVLIIDDMESMRELLGVMLPLSGHEVVGEAADGAAGLAEARRLHPDAVVVDGQMPVMDGWRAARELRQVVPAPKVVMFSAAGRSHARIAALAAGVDTYVDKASGPRAVVEALDTLALAG